MRLCLDFKLEYSLENWNTHFQPRPILRRSYVVHPEPEFEDEQNDNHNCWYLDAVFAMRVDCDIYLQLKYIKEAMSVMGQREVVFVYI
jgi:hypothetical protein